MRNRFINHARNVWDRAVTLLPRVDQLWYKVCAGLGHGEVPDAWPQCVDALVIWSRAGLGAMAAMRAERIIRQCKMRWQDFEAGIRTCYCTLLPLYCEGTALILGGHREMS